MDQSDIQLTGFLIFPVALIGVIINWTALYILRKSPAFRHSFGYLSSSQTIADAINSTLFLIYFCPMVICDSHLLQEYSQHCEFLLVLYYEISVLTHFVMSINRFFAVWTPFKYAVWFNNRNTKIMIVLVWVLCLADSMIFYEVLCNFFYDPTTGFFSFTPTSWCEEFSLFADYYKNLTIIIAIVIIDIVTVLKVRSIRNKVHASAHPVSTREINFLKQTVFQGAVFALEISAYFLLPQYLSNPWAVFFATSFGWVAIHAMDGVILMMLNPEFKKFIVTRAISQQVSAIGTLDSVIQQ